MYKYTWSWLKKSKGPSYIEDSKNNTDYVLSSYYVLGTALGTLYELSHLIFKTMYAVNSICTPILEMRLLRH